MSPDRTTRRNIVNILLLACLVGTLLFSAGCVRARLNVDVDSSGGANLDYKVGLDKSANLLSVVGADPLATIQEDLRKQGFAISGWSDAQYEGFRATQHVDKLDGIPGLSADGDQGVKLTRGVPFDTLAVNSSVQLDSGMLAEVQKLSGFDMGNLGDSQRAALDKATSDADVVLTMHLPMAVTSTNASNVSEDRSTLTWALLPGQATDLRAEARAVGPWGWAVGAGLLALLLLLLAGGLVLLSRRRLGGSGSDEPTEIVV